ncbi:hypothetical protein F7725_011517 [Dissostichus mawsoni]|uniref:Interleukin-12 subunit alpha n=1 Tax=Dissostichus mawsoni TaxID=36200 RepID=A0A7J5Z9G2_DISMA|nr:hypothetical protein F7725_011517 [Dissostichus mawsoni]
MLLLVLTCSQVSQSLPLMVKGTVTDSLVFSSQILLHKITDALTKDELFSGINCSQEMVKLNNETETPSVCAPKGSKCSGINKTEFDQDLCLENIGKDLHHYFTFLAAQSDPDKLIDPTLSGLRELMQDASENSSSFDKKLNLCKVLKGFQVRSITINRVLSYMNSGEHTK